MSRPSAVKNASTEQIEKKVLELHAANVKAGRHVSYAKLKETVKQYGANEFTRQDQPGVPADAIARDEATRKLRWLEAKTVSMGGEGRKIRNAARAAQAADRAAGNRTKTWLDYLMSAMGQASRDQADLDERISARAFAICALATSKGGYIPFGQAHATATLELTTK